MSVAEAAPLEGYARYAVYYAPEPDSALARLGAAWLGWDPAAGAHVERLETPPPPRPVEELTADPARYGLHGTMKAPFRLAEEADVAGLDRALRAFAAERAAVEAPGLAFFNTHGFTALRPNGPSLALDALAADCVRELDLFRAPLTEADRARRGADRLSPQLRENLERWGYPYIFEQFHFHLTLSGRLSEEDGAALRALLEPIFAPALEPAFRVASVCLFGDPGGGAPFRLLKRYPLTG